MDDRDPVLSSQTKGPRNVCDTCSADLSLIDSAFVSELDQHTQFTFAHHLIDSAALTQTIFVER